MQFFTLDAIVFALLIIRKFGFISKAKSEETGEVSTSNALFNCLRDQADGRFENLPNGADADFAATKADLELARKVKAWVPTLDATASSSFVVYMAAVQAALASEMCGTRDLGILAAGVNSYLRDQEVEGRLPSAHVGTIGHRVPLTLKVMFLRDYESDYGGGTMVKFADKEGNDFVWFASRGCSWDVGDVVTVTATIKAHDEYKGRAQTVLTRVTGV